MNEIIITGAKTIKGRLTFFDLDTIGIITEDGVSDFNLAGLLKDFLSRNNGTSAVFKYNQDGFILKTDETSKMLLVWRENRQTTLEKEDSLSMTNFSAYASGVFESLNARLVTVELTPASFKISFDPVEDVPGVYYGGEGNLCPIRKKDVENICGLGTGLNTCIFLIGGTRGFECCKFSSMARDVLVRLKKGKMVAQRIGNCRILGRK